MPGFADENPGFKTFVFAALFPVNLLLILLTGGILFTGTAAACPAAVYERKIRIVDAARCLAISWWGNVLGSLLFAVFTMACDLLEGPTARDAILITQKKTAKNFGITFLRGIGCNWMVCMAVFLSGQAQDMTGKYLGIWFPISTFVMIGFEHIPANFYITELGLIADVAKTGYKFKTASGATSYIAEPLAERGFEFVDVLWKNWIPVTLGNFVAGAFFVAGGYSCFYGNLGTELKNRFGKKEETPQQNEKTPVPVVTDKPKEPSGWERCISEDAMQGV